MQRRGLARLLQHLPLLPQFLAGREREALMALPAGDPAALPRLAAPDVRPPFDRSFGKRGDDVAVSPSPSSAR